MKIRFAEIEFDLERVKSEFGRYQDETKKDLILLKSELEKEKSHCETERNKRLQQEKENQALQRLWNYPATGGTIIERDHPVTSLPDNESVISETLDNISISGVSQVDQTFSFDRSGSSSMIGPGIIETLQAQLKQREGEVFQFRAERTQERVNLTFLELNGHDTNWSWRTKREKFTCNVFTISTRFSPLLS